MRIEVDDKFANIIVDAIDSLIKQYDAYGYKIDDIPQIASIGIAFKLRAQQAIKDADDPEAKYNEEHPEFVRGPNPDEHQVLGRGYVKNKPDEK